MTSKYLFPAVDTDGWTKTSVKVADYLFSHFFLSDYSQTAVFNGKVASFAWILQRNQSDISSIMSVTQETLSQYFSKQFDEVEVEVYEIPNEESINDHKLTLFLSFKDKDGVSHNLERIIKYQGLKVTEIISVVNNG